MKPEIIWIVTRVGPEWSEIVGVYRSEESAKRKTEKCRLRNAGSKDVFDQLSGYGYKSHELHP